MGFVLEKEKITTKDGVEIEVVVGITELPERKQGEFLTVDHFQRVSELLFSKTYFPIYSRPPVFYAAGIAEELGELMQEMMLAINNHKDHEGVRAAEEVADIITYCFLFLSRLGVDAETVMENKLNKVSDTSSWS